MRAISGTWIVILGWSLFVDAGEEAGAARHPFHVTLAEAEYDPATKSLEVALRVYPLDFEKGLTVHAGRRVSFDYDEDIDERITAYLRETFRVRDAQGTIAPLTWVGKEVEIQHAWLYFEVSLPGGLSGVQLENKILMEIQRDQANTVTLREGERSRSLTFVRETPRHSLTWPPEVAGAQKSPDGMTWLETHAHFASGDWLHPFLGEARVLVVVTPEPPSREADALRRSWLEKLSEAGLVLAIDAAPGPTEQASAHISRGGDSPEETLRSLHSPWDTLAFLADIQFLRRVQLDHAKIRLQVLGIEQLRPTLAMVASLRAAAAELLTYFRRFARDQVPQVESTLLELARDRELFRPGRPPAPALLESAEHIEKIIRAREETARALGQADDWNLALDAAREIRRTLRVATTPESPRPSSVSRRLEALAENIAYLEREHPDTRILAWITAPTPSTPSEGLRHQLELRIPGRCRTIALTSGPVEIGGASKDAGFVDLRGAPRSWAAAAQWDGVVVAPEPEASPRVPPR